MHPLFLSHIVPNAFFTHSSHDFLGQPFFLFPVISSSITSRIWELMSQRMTWPYHLRWLWIIIPSLFTTTPTLFRRTSVDTFINRSHRMYHPDHATLHPTQPHLIRNSKFPRFTTVQQNWSNTAINPRLMIETKFRDNSLIMIRLLKLFK